MNDGKLIRIAIPPLTEERRKELSKVAKKYTEDAKVAIRNIRRDVNDALKKLEKDKVLSEDELKKAMDDIQKLTDSYVAKSDAKASPRKRKSWKYDPGLRRGFFPAVPRKETTDRTGAETLCNKQLPQHIAIIMDGNGRWAQRRGMPAAQGIRGEWTPCGSC